jgi:hypothetical protein
MPLEQARDLLVQPADLLFDELQALERHLYKPTIEWVELPARTWHVMQLRRYGTQPLIDLIGGPIDAGTVSPSARADNMRRALAPNRSETKLDNLMAELTA